MSIGTITIAVFLRLKLFKNLEHKAQLGQVICQRKNSKKFYAIIAYYLLMYGRFRFSVATDEAF